MNLATFKINAAIMHDVPRGGGDDEPRLTEANIRLDSGLESYFGKKIKDSLESRGVEVVPDPDSDSPVVSQIASVLLDSSCLVEQSQLIASALHEAQTGRNSAGLVTVIFGEIDQQPCVCVMKLEREQGLRFDIQTDEDGNHVVDLELLRQLTLTDRTKVFKTSLFTAADASDPETVVGRVSDDQRGRQEGVGVASFYLGDFLGCQLRDSPAKQTLAFFEATEKAVNELVADPETQGRYQIALLSELQSNALEVQPAAFIRDHVDVVHQDAFRAAFRDAELDLRVPITKDISRVKVNKFRVDFESGIYLVGSPQQIAERVRLPAADAVEPITTINDAVGRMGGR